MAVLGGMKGVNVFCWSFATGIGLNEDVDGSKVVLVGWAEKEAEMLVNFN